MKIGSKLISACVGVAMTSTQLASDANAWGLKTHFWIGQQVINDVQDDGKITLAGRSYEVDEQIRRALIDHPDRFRMGNLGPDVFPDPVVGQTTTHPGLKKGWKTDEWLKHLITSADSPDEVAMAFGFVAHAAGDVFAHTYVNAYAGDVFILTDDERDVERRHFVLEKYIEALTPLPTDNSGSVVNFTAGLGTSTDYLRDTLILGKEVARQNSMEGSGLHLDAMFQVRRAVNNVDRETQKVIAEITKFGAKFLKQQAKLQFDMATGKHALDGAELTLKGANELLEVKRKAYEAALDGLSKANEVVQKHPELITFQNEILANQIKLAVDATAEATKFANEIGGIIGGIQNEIDGLLGKLGDLVCKLTFGLSKDCERLIDKINGLRQKIDVTRATLKALQEAADIAAKNRDGTKRLIDKLNDEYNNAVKGIAEGTFQATVTVAEAELKSQEKIVEESRKIVEEAQKLQNKLSDEFDKVTGVVDEIKKAVDKFNPITLVVQNWLGDIDEASGEYIKASHRAGEKMLLNSGNPLSEYKDWLSCYGPVFMARPIEIGQVTCDVKDFVEEIKGKFDEAIESLPELLQWALFPAKTAKKVALEELEPELKDATFELVGFVTDETTADFLSLLADPENATRAKLNSVFAQDESGKNLLQFGEVGQLVDADLRIQNGTLTPGQFPPLNHAVTLAKLSLLQPTELNRLTRDLGGQYESIYGPEVYPPSEQLTSALLGAVTSIDGNHQWQAFGLPYPRKLGVTTNTPAATKYGRNYWDDRSSGFRIWVDPYLREKVFLTLFPEAMMGALRERPELKYPNYGFPECASNPFPQTQSQLNGAALSADRRCVDTTRPDVPLITQTITNKEDYQSLFFECGTPISGNQHWTVVGSFRGEDSARRHARAIDDKYPDIAVEVWRPRKFSRYWRVMTAACTTREKAEQARQTALRRGYAPDAFVFELAPQWERIVQ